MRKGRRMSSADITLAFEDVLRGAASGRPAVLRLALRRGEALRIPASRRHIRVLAGTAWVSQAGEDLLVGESRCLGIRRRGDAAVVSPVGGEGLLFEVW
jgi:hypothetical protein